MADLLQLTVKLVLFFDSHYNQAEMTKHLKGEYIQDIPYVVLDTETTGLHPGQGDRITEIAAIRYENGQEVARINQLVNPQRAIDPKAIEIAGITDNDVANQPIFSDIAEDVLSILAGAIIVAHNAKFDAHFLGLEMWLAGFDRGTKKAVLPNPWICTLKLARECFFFGRNNLAHVAHQMNIPVGKTHRALADVYTTAKVFERMIVDFNGRKPPIQTVSQFFDAQGRPIFCPFPPEVNLPDLLAEAIEQEALVKIAYTTRNGRKIITETILPRYAITYQTEPYLIAHSHDYNVQKPYLLNKIKEITPVSPFD